MFEDNQALTLDVGLDALKQAVRVLKVKKVRDLPAYFYGVLMKMFKNEFFAELQEIKENMVY